MTALGTIMILTGQALRTLAMHQAGHAFTHEVAYVKVQGHYLVKDGVYRYQLEDDISPRSPKTLLDMCGILPTWAFTCGPLELRWSLGIQLAL